MIRHLFKLMWNSKRRNALLMIEIFFSYLVLFAVASATISTVIGYLRPLGFDHAHTWILSPNLRGGAEQSDAERRPLLQQLTKELSVMPEIRAASWMGGCLPYLNSVWITSLGSGDQLLSLYLVMADDQSAEALGISLDEGRWFGPEDDGSSRKPVVITRQTADELLGDRPAVGAVLTDKDSKGNITEYVVVGVAENFRFQGEFSAPVPVYFQRSLVSDTSAHLPENLVIGVRDNVGMAFEEQLSKQLAAAAPGWNFRIMTLTDQRKAYIRDHVLGILTFATVASFLVFNVALGLFGVLWYSINRRRSEIGLRRAVGADRVRISSQILGEAAVLATFGIAAGLFVAAQVPILGLEESIGGPIYVLAMLVAAILIYLLVGSCAVYPSRLAARIQPARALSDE